MISERIEEIKNTENCVLLDVREADEYADGHLEGAVNVPLSQIEQIPYILKDKTQKIFLYCRSGRRSDEAIRFMSVMGYTDLENIGGLKEYTGELVK